MLASAILNRLKVALNDAGLTRWTEAELLLYLSDAQRQLVNDRPDAHLTVGPVELVEGTKQALPDGGLRLIDVTRNLGADGLTPGAPVRVVPRETMDALLPDWHSDDAATDVRQYVYDNRYPTAFYVYPPATDGYFVEGIYSTEPAELTASTDELAVSGIYANQLLDWCLYRAFSKDGAGANAARAAAAYAAYKQAVGDKNGTDLIFSPNRNAPPQPGVK